MNGSGAYYLAINAGSSSIKFSLFRAGGSLAREFDGSIQGIGFESATFSIKSSTEADNYSQNLVADNHLAALAIVLGWIEQKVPREDIAAVGHRIVHGGPNYSGSCIITEEVITELHLAVIFDPEHLPAQLQLIEAFERAFPGVPQIACFDTAFHHNLPTVARLLPIPRRYEAQGLRRYGFHGLSYSYLMQELRNRAGEEAANGKIILAHLGNGVSLAAVSGGQSIDTTMGLTPAGGIPMSTRSGDIDPGLVSYLAKTNMTDEQFNMMIGFESGLLGISETSADMKKLLEIEHEDPRAADAIALFCYQVKKQIGAYAAALGGVDTLVFSGGMGENAPAIRARICDGLQFLGIELDTSRNLASSEVISSDQSRAEVRVIHTDEAVTIIREMSRLMEQRK